MDVFGGPRQLARSLADVIDSAKPGSMISANVLSAVLKIHLLVETNPAPVEMPATLESKRAALAREFRDFLLQQIHERPEELADLMRAAGWQVERPEPSSHDSFLAATQERLQPRQQRVEVERERRVDDLG